jgi:ATP-dependent exoDNAse (exonuclease V) alpha subunit
VKHALDYLEVEATRVRIGKGGAERIPAGMVASIWMHGASRADEPDLHHHVTVFNVGVTPDGKTRTICGELFFMHKLAAGALYRAELARLLERELGVSVYRPTEEVAGRIEKKSWFEIKGVPNEQMERWSTRSKEIAKEAWAKGLEGSKGKEVAALATRERKSGTSMRELFSAWKRDALAHGFSQESVQRRQPAERDKAVEVAQAVTASLQNLTREKSHWTRRDLVQQVGVEAQGRGLAASDILQAVEEVLEDSPEVVRLGSSKARTAGPRNAEPRFTTRATLDMEKRLLESVEAAKGKNAHLVREASVLQAIQETEAEESKKAGKAITFTAEQVEAVRRFCRGENAIEVLTGDAGTGKSTTCLAARKAFELDGYRCIGAALARKAASGLETGSGIKSASVAKTLYDLDVTALDRAKHHVEQLGRAFTRSVYEDMKDTPIVSRLIPERWKRKPYQREFIDVDARTVVFVDEANLVGTRQMEELVTKVRERGGKLILLGDAKQLSPVEAGLCFTAIAGIVGQARLSEIRRQHKEEDKEAIRALSRGDAREAFQSYAERGLVKVAPTRRAAIREMVSDWAKTGTENPKEALLICATNLERGIINNYAQDAMREAGKLGRKKIAIGGADAHVGDRVAFLQNSTYHGVNNGDTGTVVGISTKPITRKTFHGKQFRSLWAMAKYAEKVKKDKTIYLTVELDTGKTVQIPLERYGASNVRLGYCLNTHHAEGMTTTDAFILTGGAMTSREVVYVQCSRSRNAPRVYTDRQSAGDKLCELAKQASKSRAKDMAHDYLDSRAPTDEPRLEVSR